MNYEQAQQYVYSFADYEKTPVPHAAANYDLRRVYELLAKLGDPHLKARSVHITGTKGKGSTAAMIASILQYSDYKAGLYTSPHLLKINERIQVNGQPVSDADFAELAGLVQPAVAAVNKKATYGKLTTFEVLTAMAFSHFARQNTDFQVLEVGLGGTYDATNVIPVPEVAVITSISYDHMEILGNTMTLIAGEKGGIIKKGGTVVSAPQVPEAAAVIERICRERECRLVRVGTDVTWQPGGFNMEHQEVTVRGRKGAYHLRMPLLGEVQQINAATAVAAAEVIAERGRRISAENMAAGMAGVKWPGRFQVTGRKPWVVLDGAHNSESAARLGESLRKYLKFDRAVLVLGASSDKDIEGIAAGLAPLFREVIATRSRNPRAMATERVAGAFAAFGLTTRTAPDVKSAVERAKELAGENGLVCVTGSLFVVAEALEMLKV